MTETRKAEAKQIALGLMNLIYGEGWCDVEHGDALWVARRMLIMADVTMTLEKMQELAEESGGLQWATLYHVLALASQSDQMGGTE